MTYDEQTFPNRMHRFTQDMTAILDDRDRLPDGPTKALAIKHYRAAEMARAAKNDDEADRELRAARVAQADVGLSDRPVEGSTKNQESPSPSCRSGVG